MQIACTASGAPVAERLRVFARAAATAATEVTLRIVGTAEGRRLNRAYRGRDRATNVLTFRFPRTAPQAPRAPHRGDIILCHPVIAREARAQGKTIEAHYAHLVVHGLLHLRGYDHERARDAMRMEQLETAILGRLGYDDPYAAEPQ